MTGQEDKRGWENCLKSCMLRGGGRWDDFIKWRWRACDGVTVVGAGVVSRDSTSLDKDLTRLRKGLEDDSAADLQGEEELELVDGALVEGWSDGQEELAGGLELRWDWVAVGIIVMAGEGVCG